MRPKVLVFSVAVLNLVAGLSFGVALGRASVDGAAAGPGTVEVDLSKLAQQFMGDRFKFYILARYNDMANPNRLAAGQVIKIPGKAPPVTATPVRPPASETAEVPATTPSAEAEAPPSEAVTLLSLFNDVIVREAARERLPVLDLRLVCDEPRDYSAVSPIEPSQHGGNKIATAVAYAVASHDFGRRESVVYGKS